MVKWRAIHGTDDNAHSVRNATGCQWSAWVCLLRTFSRTHMLDRTPPNCGWANEFREVAAWQKQ